MDPLTRGHIPLVQRSVVRTGDELEVVQGPGHARDLSLVALQCVKSVEGDCVVDFDGVL